MLVCLRCIVNAITVESAMTACPAGSRARNASNVGKLDISLVSAELEGETHDRLHSKMGEPGGNRDLQKLSGIPSRASPEMCGLRRSQLTW